MRYLPHVFTALEFGGDSTDDAAKSRLLYNLALAVSNQGNYKEAEQLFRQMFALQTEVLGAQHPNTLRAMNNLASTVCDQGNYKARKLSMLTECNEYVL